MTAPYSPDDREKVNTKLPVALRRALKIRAAQCGVGIQDAVTDGIRAWRSASDALPVVEMAASQPFSTYLPAGLYADFKVDCKARGVAFNQGMAQAIDMWMAAHPAPRREARPSGARRLIFGNQKGGVGKTSTASGTAQALAEQGFLVCIVDFDPQCHLTKQLGQALLGIDEPSLAKFMLGEGKGELRDLLVPIQSASFEDRLFLLPGCKDAFLLDAKLATSRYARVKETALEKALEPLEQQFDYIVIDCPPSLGYSMDTALYYCRTRENEDESSSGIFIPVLAEDSSADAYDMLFEQIEDLTEDMEIEIAILGFVVNMYDARRGYIATSSLDEWQKIGDPPVVTVIPDVKEQREAVRMKQPLLAYAPDCEQSEAMREIARKAAA